MTRTVRIRLTALYGGLFLTAVTALLITVDLLLQNAFDQKLAMQGGRSIGVGMVPAGAPPPKRFQGVAVQVVTRDLRDTVLRSQWIVSAVALVVLAVVAVVAGWWVAGRVLRPVHQITETARRLSLSNLNERIALTGPRDEFTDLADTFDQMLARLEAAFDSQRRFVVNASHELRTPLAVQRAAIQIGLEDPTPERLARTRAELLEANRRSERLIEGLLTLAQGERGLSALAPVALDEVTRDALDQQRQAAAERGVTVEIDVVSAEMPAEVSGDHVLLTRLAANLIDNAIRYNTPGGHVAVCVTRAGLTVTNTGPEVPADRITEMFEPFRRLHATRTGSDGTGLGLSIVRSIADAHDALVYARPRPGGGLEVSVGFHADRLVGAVAD